MKENFEVILITYNRALNLQKTLSTCFCDESPLKNFDFTVIDNNSTDETEKICFEYQTKFPNFKYIKNKVNIGGSANICRAFETVKKKYVWFLCDDDIFDFSSWNEIENAIKEDVYDAILTRKIKETKKESLETFFVNASFIPAAIYNTENITSTVIQNAYDNTKTMLPHLALPAKIINDEGKIFVPNKPVITAGPSRGKACYVRGAEISLVPPSKRYMIWGVGFMNSLELISDNKKRDEITEHITHHIKSIFNSTYTFFVHSLLLNYLACDDYNHNKYLLKKGLNFRHGVIFNLARLYVKIRTLFVDKNLYEPGSIELNRKKYFKKVNQQKYINKLAKKYKNKKILVYGAGLIFNFLNDEYDLSKLNIKAISDAKFTPDDTEYKGYSVITPDKIEDGDYDLILFAMYRSKDVELNFNKKGISTKTKSLVKRSLKAVWSM